MEISALPPGLERAAPGILTKLSRQAARNPPARRSSPVPVSFAYELFVPSPDYMDCHRGPRRTWYSYIRFSEWRAEWRLARCQVGRPSFTGADHSCAVTDGGARGFLRAAAAGADQRGDEAPRGGSRRMAGKTPQRRPNHAPARSLSTGCSSAQRLRTPVSAHYQLYPV